MTPHDLDKLSVALALEQRGLNIEDAIEKVAAHVITSGDYQGHTALTLAASMGKLHVIQALINKDKKLATHVIPDGPHKGLTALIAAVNFTGITKTAIANKTKIIELLINTGIDVNLRDAKGNTARSESKKSGNKNIENILKAHGAYPSIDQTTLLLKFAKWLEIQTKESEDKYNVEFVTNLTKKLVEGGCNGFSWIHRIISKYGDEEEFQDMMRFIADWDEIEQTIDWDQTSETLHPILNLLFNKILQTTIYAQASEPLLLTTSKLKADEQLAYPKHQGHIIIPKMLSPEPIGIVFSDLLHIYEEYEYISRDMKALKKLIDDKTKYGGIISLAAECGTEGLHAVDVGKVIKNKNEVYFLYDPNGSEGQVTFEAFHDFFTALKISMDHPVETQVFNMEINVYLPPLHYNYSEFNTHEWHQQDSIEEYMKSNTEKHTTFEFWLNNGDCLIVDIENEKFILFNPKENVFGNLNNLISELNNTIGDQTQIQLVTILKRTPPKLPSKLLNDMLIATVKEGLDSRVKILIDAGASPSHVVIDGDKKYRGHNALSLAVAFGYSKVVKALLDTDVSMTLANQLIAEGPFKGDAALSLAKKAALGDPKKDRSEIVTLLRTHLVKNRKSAASQKTRRQLTSQYQSASKSPNRPSARTTKKPKRKPR